MFVKPKKIFLRNSFNSKDTFIEDNMIQAIPFQLLGILYAAILFRRLSVFIRLRSSVSHATNVRMVAVTNEP